MDLDEFQHVIDATFGERDRARGVPSSVAWLAEEVGDLLFAVANLARRLEIEPETALRNATLKFERRFRRIEETLDAAGSSAADASLETMEEHWVKAKAEGL